VSAGFALLPTTRGPRNAAAYFCADISVRSTLHVAGPATAAAVYALRQDIQGRRAEAIPDMPTAAMAGTESPGFPVEVRAGVFDEMRQAIRQIDMLKA
jgi:hypothetical protein